MNTTRFTDGYLVIQAELRPFLQRGWINANAAMIHGQLTSWMNDAPADPDPTKVGTSWSGIDSIAAHLGLGRNTVKRCIRDLERVGLLYVWEVVDSEGQDTNRYAAVPFWGYWKPTWGPSPFNDGGGKLVPRRTPHRSALRIQSDPKAAVEVYRGRRITRNELDALDREPPAQNGPGGSPKWAGDPQPKMGHNIDLSFFDIEVGEAKASPPPPSDDGAVVESPPRPTAEQRRDAEFEQWWSDWPRKVDKAASRKIWHRLKLAPQALQDLRTSQSHYLDARDRYKALYGAYPADLMYPSTWLGGRWEDFVDGPTLERWPKPTVSRKDKADADLRSQIAAMARPADEPVASRVTIDQEPPIDAEETHGKV